MLKKIVACGLMVVVHCIMSFHSTGSQETLSVANGLDRQTTISDKVSFSDSNSEITFSYQLRITNCWIRAETTVEFTSTEFAEDEGESIRAEMEYEIDLTHSIILAAAPTEWSITGRRGRAFKIQPAKLVSKRVTTEVYGERLPREDVPIFADDTTTLTLLLRPGKVGELTPLIESARSRCQKRAPGVTTGFAILSDEDIAEIAKRSIIYISVEGERSGTGEIVERNGTGFAIANEGFVVTAKHILQDERGKPFHRIRKLIGVVGGGRSTSHEIPLRKIREHPDHDVALLKLENASHELASVVACKDTPRAGAKLIAYGFPLGTDFSSTTGNFSNDSGPGGRWQVTMDFTFGMSGGPVFDENGRVRGIIKGGIPDEPIISWVIPIRYIDGWLREHDTLIQCVTH